MSDENSTDTTCKSNFTSSNTVIDVGEKKVLIRILNMTDSTMIFICNAELEVLDEMGLAVLTGNNSEAIGTSVLGPHTSSDSQRMAEKLTKRFRRPFYVSFNVQMDRIVGPLMEMKIYEYIRGQLI